MVMAGVSARNWAALIATPIGRVIRSSVPRVELPGAFAAQFSLSHLTWLITYPIAGWLGVSLGFPITWAVLAALALVGAVTAWVLWPGHSTSAGRDRKAV